MLYRTLEFTEHWFHLSVGVAQECHNLSVGGMFGWLIWELGHSEKKTKKKQKFECIFERGYSIDFSVIIVMLFQISLVLSLTYPYLYTPSP